MVTDEEETEEKEALDIVEQTRPNHRSVGARTFAFAP